MRAIESLEAQGFINTNKVLGKRTKYSLNLLKTPDTHVTPDKLSPLTQCHHTPDTHVTTPLTPMSPEPVIPVSKPVNKYSEQDYSLAEWIYSLVLITAPKSKTPNLDKWANTIRVMVNTDGHTHREIAEVFRWANSDHFWNTNILSPEKLRKQFAKLHAQVINNEQQHKQSAQPSPKLSVVERTKLANEERERARQARAGHGPPMAETAGNIRPSAQQPIRSDNSRELGAVIDGSFSRTD